MRWRRVTIAACRFRAEAPRTDAAAGSAPAVNAHTSKRLVHSLRMNSDALCIQLISVPPRAIGNATAASS